MPNPASPEVNSYRILVPRHLKLIHRKRRIVIRWLLTKIQSTRFAPLKTYNSDMFPSLSIALNICPGHKTHNGSINRTRTDITGPLGHKYVQPANRMLDQPENPADEGGNVVWASLPNLCALTRVSCQPDSESTVASHHRIRSIPNPATLLCRGFR